MRIIDLPQFFPQDRRIHYPVRDGETIAVVIDQDLPALRSLTRMPVFETLRGLWIGPKSFQEQPLMRSGAPVDA